MKEIELSRWRFELPSKLHSQFSPSGSTFLHCLSLPSISENSISSIFLEYHHQVDMKIFVKSSKHFFGYFNTLETHSEQAVGPSASLVIVVYYILPTGRTKAKVHYCIIKPNLTLLMVKGC